MIDPAFSAYLVILCSFSILPLSMMLHFFSEHIFNLNYSLSLRQMLLLGFSLAFCCFCVGFFVWFLHEDFCGELMNRDHSVVFEIAPKYCSFVDYEGFSTSSTGFFTVVDIMVI